jgi:hypothetical protein
MSITEESIVGVTDLRDDNGEPAEIRAFFPSNRMPSLMERVTYKGTIYLVVSVSPHERGWEIFAHVIK